MMPLFLETRPEARPEPRFTTWDVHRLTAVSLRQLQTWDERGYLPAVREGHRRYYRRRELGFVMLYRELYKRKFSIYQVCEVWRRIQQQGHDLIDSQAIWLVTNGADVRMLAGVAEALSFMSQPRPGYALIDLTDLRRKIDEASGCLSAPRKPMDHAGSASPADAERALA